MDERQFLTRIQDKLNLVMGAIADKQPLMPVAIMLLDRRMDEREFLIRLKHQVDLAATQIAIHPALEEISALIQHQLNELNFRPPG